MKENTVPWKGMHTVIQLGYCEVVNTLMLCKQESKLAQTLWKQFGKMYDILWPSNPPLDSGWRQNKKLKQNLYKMTLIIVLCLKTKLKQVNYLTILWCIYRTNNNLHKLYLKTNSYYVLLIMQQMKSCFLQFNPNYENI